MKDERVLETYFVFGFSTKHSGICNSNALHTKITAFGLQTK